MSGSRNDAAGRVGPAAAAVNAGVGAHGADDGVSGNRRGFNLLDEVIEDLMGVEEAAGRESGGVGVAVDRGVVSESVFGSDFTGVTPEEEVGFEFFAAGVTADRALTDVAAEVRGEAH